MASLLPGLVVKLLATKWHRLIFFFGHTKEYLFLKGKALSFLLFRILAHHLSGSIPFYLNRLHPINVISLLKAGIVSQRPLERRAKNCGAVLAISGHATQVFL